MSNDVTSLLLYFQVLSPVELDKYLQRSVNAAESKAANSFHCKTPNCAGWCYYEDDVNWFPCGVCLKKNCLTCKAIHEGKTCQEYQDDLKVRAENDDAAKKTQKMLEVSFHLFFNGTT